MHNLAFPIYYTPKNYLDQYLKISTEPSLLNLITFDGLPLIVPPSTYKSTLSPKYFFASAIVSLGGLASKFAEGAISGPVSFNSACKPADAGTRNAKVFVPRCRYSSSSSGQSKTMLTGHGQYFLIAVFCFSERMIENFSSSLSSPTSMMQGLLGARFRSS